MSKISFNGGDLAYWAPRPSVWFRQHLAELPSFLQTLYQRENITDQVLFGDRRPVHVSAVLQARACGVRTHVFEEGYFRPNWITLEREGVNARSLLPRDPAWFRRVGRSLLEAPAAPPQAFTSPFWRRAAHDVAYHLASGLNPLLFTQYRAHATVSAPIEYAGFLKHQFRGLLAAKQAHARIEALLTQNEQFYFLPLQLNSDYQVRDQPVLNTMSALLEQVLASFAAHAPVNTRLVIKNHPLDIAQGNYLQLLNALSVRFGLTQRLDYFETGDLSALLRRAIGTVTLNSTMGASMLEVGCPTLCLAQTPYNLPGLTAQCGLDAFWTQLPQPDPELFRFYQTAVLHTTQVNGGFYSPEEIERAAQASALILESELSPLERCL